MCFKWILNISIKSRNTKFNEFWSWCEEIIFFWGGGNTVAASVNRRNYSRPSVMAELGALPHFKHLNVKFELKR